MRRFSSGPSICICALGFNSLPCILGLKTFHLPIIGSKFSPTANDKKPDLEAIKSQPSPSEDNATKTTPVNTPKSAAGATTVKAEKDLPKAMIKPNVLTHVIEGFIIQEANEPFAVTRQRYSDKDQSDEPPSTFYFC